MHLQASLAILSATVFAASASAADRSAISHQELVSLLDIKKWVVPLPKDDKYRWQFDVRDYQEYSVVTKGKKEWAHPGKTASFTLMPTGEGNIYRFWVTHPDGTSIGKTRLDVCDNSEDVAAKCDAHMFDTQWYDKPLRIDDGKTYLLGEFTEPNAPGRRKQLVLSFGPFRLKDM